MEFPQSISQQL